MTRMHLQIALGMASTDLELLVPYYGDAGEKKGMSEEEYYNGEKFKCVWLLHGLGGSCEDWVRFTQIETWAMEKNVFVICPSGGTGFYTRGKTGFDWETLITKTEWDYLHRLFPMMSEKPEDNLVAGFSMGGYGAMYYALKYPEKFGYGCSLDGGLNMPQRYAEGENFNGRLQFAFGASETVADGPFDLYRAAKDLMASGRKLPRIYIACGALDWEYEPNKEFRDFMIEQGYDVTWDEEAEYTHEWRMMNIELERVLNFMIPENFYDAKFTRDHIEEEEE